MAATVKFESESDIEVDPLSTHSENELPEMKQEKFLVPVVMTESEVGFSLVCHTCIYCDMIPTGNACDAACLLKCLFNNYYAVHYVQDSRVMNSTSFKIKVFCAML
jgi:hypothetical protein